MDDSMLQDFFLVRSPVYGPNGTEISSRLTILPRQNSTSISVASLLATIGQARTTSPTKALWLNLLDERLLRLALSSLPQKRMTIIEVPSFMLSMTDIAGAAAALHQQGGKIAIKGHAMARIHPSLAPHLFARVTNPRIEERLRRIAPPQGNCPLPQVHEDINGIESVHRSFDVGALGVMGWPTEDPARVDIQGQLMGDLQRLLSCAGQGPEAELRFASQNRSTINSWRRSAYSERLLACVTRSSTKALQGGRPANASDHQRAILGRWIPLIANACDDRDTKLLASVARHRARLMEQLVSPGKHHPDEAFLCGALSLLHKIFNSPLPTLLDMFFVPDNVRAALLHDIGPLAPGMRLIRAMESERIDDIEFTATAAGISPQRLNRLVLKSLANAATDYSESGVERALTSR